MDKAVIKELLQDDFTIENVKTEVNKIVFEKEHKQGILKNYDNIRNMLGNKGASEKAATLMFSYLTEENNA